MIGIVYETQSKRVISRIENVQEHTETDVTGADSSAKGIDRTKAAFVIVESTILEPGDTIDLTKTIDSRHLIPETDAQKIARLEKDNTQLESQFKTLSSTVDFLLGV